MMRAQTGTNSLIYVAKWPNLVKEFSLSFQALVKVSFLFQHTLQLTFKDYDITNSCPITQSHCWRFFVGIWNSFFNLIGRLDAKQSIWELWNLMQSCDWTGRLVSSLAMGTSPYARRGVMTRIGNYSHVRADIFNPMVWGFLIYIQVTQLVLSVFTVVCFYCGLFLPWFVFAFFTSAGICWQCANTIPSSLHFEHAWNALLLPMMAEHIKIRLQSLNSKKAPPPARWGAVGFWCFFWLIFCLIILEGALTLKR